MNNLVVTVSQLNTYVRSLLEQDARLTNIFVEGEISNFTNHYRSGHWYFSLKDGNAVVSAVMFASLASHIKFIPADGMKVICRGRVSLYDRDGRYQFYCEDMQPSGLGALNLAFEQTKERLLKEGLLDPTHKKPLPVYPGTVAVITSPTGAALQDILNILSRRWPAVKVLVCPVQVQGENAASQMTGMVKKVGLRSDIDLIILGRGGGSLEDLWAFNDETLARAVFDCPIPVISAVGHETDVTITDFVADLRAPTPSAAAELAVPDRMEVLSMLAVTNLRLRRLTEQRVLDAEQRLDRCVHATVFSGEGSAVNGAARRMEDLKKRLQTAVIQNLQNISVRAENCFSRLEAYSPLGVLARGYCLAQNEAGVIRSVGQLLPGQTFDLILQDGTVTCRRNREEEE